LCEQTFNARLFVTPTCKILKKVVDMKEGTARMCRRQTIWFSFLEKEPLEARMAGRALEQLEQEFAWAMPRYYVVNE
jgi:hypothetical protein